MNGPVGVGIVGAGDISGAYLSGLSAMPDIALLGISSRNQASAGVKGAEFGVPARSVDHLLADPKVEIMLNLTPPAQHYQVTLAALNAGKHVWSEKPLGSNLGQVRELIGRADELGLRLSSAPDTFLGPASQAFRTAIGAGTLGRPVTAFASYETSGPEYWHPRPAFLYDEGGGPLLDIGPYFVVELIHLLGSVARVLAVATQGLPNRIATTGPGAGTAFPVRVDTSVLALLQFRSGVVAQLALSFEALRNRGCVLELAGTHGQIAGTDPDLFGKSPMLWRGHGAAPEPLPITTTSFRRGLGVLDLARAMRAGVPDRTNARLALHVFEVLFAIQAATNRDRIEIASHAPAIDPLPSDWEPSARTLT